MWATAACNRVGGVKEEMVGGAWRGPMKIYDKDLAEPMVMRMGDLGTCQPVRRSGLNVCTYGSVCTHVRKKNTRILLHTSLDGHREAVQDRKDCGRRKNWAGDLVSGGDISANMASPWASLQKL